jgi:hypothetical protein
MTIETTDNRISHVGDGSTIQFAFPFGIFGADDIVVYLAAAGGSQALQQRGVDYDVTLANPDDLPSPGVITFCQLPAPVPPTPLQIVKIVRTLPYTQEIEITNGGPMPAASLNEAFDRAVILMQQLQDQLSQANMSLGEVVASDFFKLLAVSGNATAARALLQAQQLNGNLSALSGLSAAPNQLPYFTGTGTMTTTTLSPFARTLLDDTSPQHARDTLEVDNTGGVYWRQLTAGTDYSSTCPSQTTITMNSDQTANIKFGTLVKVKMGGGYYVGQCVTCTAGVLTVSGVKLNTDSNALQELYYTLFSGMERDIQQVTKRYYVADGAGVNSVTATLDPPPPALVDKMHCRIVAAGANTDQMTFSPNALDAKPIVKMNNIPMVAGDIPGQYFVMDLQYNLNLDKWVLLNSGPSDGSITTAKLADTAVTQGKLKTTTTSQTCVSLGHFTLPGGTYSFFPQIKTDGYGASTVYIAYGYINSSSFVTTIYAEASRNCTYVQNTYVTSSGEVYWIFILRDKTTKKIGSVWCAPDHPCFGNGGKPSLVLHPFGEIPEGFEMIVINPTPEQVEAAESYCIKGDDEPDIGISEAFMELFDIDEYSEPDWPEVPVTVGITKVQTSSSRMAKATPQMAKSVADGTPVEIIKKVAPKPDLAICRAFKAKEANTAKEDAVHG